MKLSNYKTLYHALCQLYPLQSPVPLLFIHFNLDLKFLPSTAKWTLYIWCLYDRASLIQ